MSSASRRPLAAAPSDNEGGSQEKAALATEAAEGVADAGRCALRVADFSDEGADFSANA